VDDAVQCALIKIWRNIGYVDLGREVTVKALVMKIGVRAMRDEVRRAVAKSKEANASDVALISVDADSKPLQFEGRLLSEYVKYYEENGTFTGVHSFVSKVLGVSATSLQAEARREARRQAEAQGYVIRSMDDIFDSIIRSRYE